MGQRCLAVTVAGHLCLDLTPRLHEAAALEPGRLRDVGPLDLALGGCVANTGSALLDLGVDVRLAATVGDDVLADVLRSLVRRRFGDRAVLTTAAGTGSSYSVVVEPPGVDRTFWHHSGSNGGFRGEDLPETDLLHLGYPSLLPGLVADGGAPLAAVLAAARERGSTTSLDLAVVDDHAGVGAVAWDEIFARVLPFVDVLSPSLDDLVSALGVPAPVGSRIPLAEDLAGKLLGWGAAVVAVSVGAEGIVLRTADAARLARAGRVLAPQAAAWAGAVVHQGVLAPARIVSTNGAGDAASAGLLAALLAGMGPTDALRAAARVAATVIAGEPVTPSLLGGTMPLRPIVLPANQPRNRFYRGGPAIAEFRGTDDPDGFSPEDWVGSTTCIRGESGVGETALPDGTPLREAVAADPVGWLGAEHVAAFGPDVKLLVKLLDAGQRLPVHAHPHDDFARAHCDTAHGKAEAWSILTPGEVFLGLTRDVEPVELARMVAEQDVEAMIAAMHRVPVGAGDRVYVPPGVLHAIGEGVLLAEVQEPEDLSILLEWRDFALDGERDGHLDLGFPVALTAVEHRARTVEEIADLVRRADHPDPGLPEGAEEYFRLTRHDIDGPVVLPAGFAIIVVVEGPLDVAGIPAPRGTTVLVPASVGELTITGSGSLLACRPPAVGR